MNEEMDSIDVINNEVEGRIQAEIGGTLAYLQYREAKGMIVFLHTEVPEEMEGKGVGSKLVKAGLEHARAQGVKVIAQCPFVARYIRRHQEYQPLLASD